MNRNVRALTIALLCVLAVSLAAATLANPQQPPGASDGSGGPGVGSGTDQRDGTGDGRVAGNSSENSGGSRPTVLASTCVPFLLSPWFVAGLIAFVLVFGYAGYRRQGLVPAIVILFVMSTALIPGWLLFTDCGDGILQQQLHGGAANGTGLLEGGDASGSGGADDETAFSPPIVLAGLLVVALVLAAVVYRASGDDEPVEDPPEEEVPTDASDEEALAAIGDVAGEAADRIEQTGGGENEVYRAWHEMTTHLEVGNPQASTPTEFAAAARDAGMDEAHVETLTDLFQEVRYGDVDVTEERETRAVESLRAIEGDLAER